MDLSAFPAFAFSLTITVTGVIFFNYKALTERSSSGDMIVFNFLFPTTFII